jgi:hypothetical protein
VLPCRSASLLPLFMCTTHVKKEVQYKCPFPDSIEACRGIRDNLARLFFSSAFRKEQVCRCYKSHATRAPIASKTASFSEFDCTLSPTTSAWQGGKPSTPYSRLLPPPTPRIPLSTTQVPRCWAHTKLGSLHTSPRYCKASNTPHPLIGYQRRHVP